MESKNFSKFLITYREWTEGMEGNCCLRCKTVIKNSPSKMDKRMNEEIDKCQDINEKIIEIQDKTIGSASKINNKTMKKVFIIPFVCALLTSCNTGKHLTDATKQFVDKHNFKASVKPNLIKGTTNFTASIDSLSKTEKIKDIAPTVDVTYKISDAKIIVSGEVKGTLTTEQIIDKIKEVLSAISFKK